MPAKKRRPRDPEAMRQAILRAARQLFVRDGYAVVSMRKIANRIGYSAAAIYLYYPGKAEIFFALAEEGFDRLAAAMGAPGPEDDLLAALEERFWRYYEFAGRQPEFFWLMFVDRSVPRISHDWERIALVTQARIEGTEMVRRCVDAGLFPRGTSPAAAYHALAIAIHGAAVNRACGRLSPRPDADTVARDTLRAVIAGLRAGVALDFRELRGGRGVAGTVRRRRAPRTRGSPP
jgi:AcrR family transcriptional regulator